MRHPIACQVGIKEDQVGSLGFHPFQLVARQHSLSLVLVGPCGEPGIPPSPRSNLILTVGLRHRKPGERSGLSQSRSGNEATLTTLSVETTKEAKAPTHRIS